MASYSFSRIPLDATIQGIRRVGVHCVSIKDAHLPLKSTADQRKAVVAKFRDAGITPLSCGVIGLKGGESELRNAFEYVRDAGIPTIVCAPTPEVLPALEPLVKEFDIKLAIHNHGPEDKSFPSPLDVWEAVQKLDERIGLCIDVGHTARCGVEPVQAIRTCSARLYDVHLKDLSSREAKARAVEVGRGVLDIRGILQALRDVHFEGHVGLEHEKDMNDPLPGVAESIGYIRGTLAGMQRIDRTDASTIPGGRASRRAGTMKGLYGRLFPLSAHRGRRSRRLAGRLALPSVAEAVDRAGSPGGSPSLPRAEAVDRAGSPGGSPSLPIAEARGHAGSPGDSPSRDLSRRSPPQGRPNGDSRPSSRASSAAETRTSSGRMIPSTRAFCRRSHSISPGR